MAGANRIWLSPELQREPYLTAPPWGAATYGGLGSIIGHELAHMLPEALWLASSSRNSRSSTAPDGAWHSCVNKLFSNLAPNANLPFDLGRSLDEYMPDLVGLSLALEEMQSAANAPSDAKASGVRLQTFFVAFAQAMCAMEGDDRSTLEGFVDNHPSMLLRINGVVSQSTAFARAFGCRAGQPMAPEPRCTPW
jgi:predicted metalloendopeptidase